MTKKTRHVVVACAGSGANEQLPTNKPPLPPRLALTEHAQVIRALGKRVVADVIEIGRRLVDCKDNHLEHGEWLPWLEREFGWSRQTADNFIHVYEAQEKLPIWQFGPAG